MHDRPTASHQRVTPATPTDSTARKARPARRASRAGAPPSAGHDFGTVSVEAPHDLGRSIRESAGRGGPIASPVLGELETGLGADLGGVRVHADAEADQLARGVGAQAFTSGQDIYFRAGAYNPRSPQGLYMLAHEAAHASQQAAGPVASASEQGGVSLSAPGDRFEVAAHQAAASAVLGAAGFVVPPVAHLAASAAASSSSASAGEIPVQRIGIPPFLTGMIPGVLRSPTAALASFMGKTIFGGFNDSGDLPTMEELKEKYGPKPPDPNLDPNGMSVDPSLPQQSLQDPLPPDLPMSVPGAPEADTSDYVPPDLEQCVP